MTTTLLCEEFNPETFCGAADSFKSPSKNAVEAAKQEMATEREQLAKDEAKRQLIIDEYGSVCCASGMESGVFGTRGP